MFRPFRAIFRWYNILFILKCMVCYLYVITELVSVSGQQRSPPISHRLIPKSCDGPQNRFRGSHAARALYITDPTYSVRKRSTDNKENWWEKINISRNAFPEEDCRIHPLGPQKKLRHFNRITNLTDNRIHMSVQEKLERACRQDELWQDWKMILKYQPKGKRNLGRPLKRWKDSVL
jgi:hypothetical protein